MTIDNQLIEELAHRYFADNMPSELRDYLFDRYGEEPVEGELVAQFFLPAVIGDIESYVHGKLDTTLRTEYQKLQDRYEKLSGIISGFAEDNRRLESENQYYADFIGWMHLYKEYREFRATAHEEQDEFGFSYYTKQ